MKRMFLHVAVALAIVQCATLASAATRYIVSYASGTKESTTLLVVSQVTLETGDAGSDQLRAAFVRRLEQNPSLRLSEFAIVVKVFQSEDAAKKYREDLVERAEAVGVVEDLGLTSVQQTAIVEHQNPDEFKAWPFDHKEAKHRQLLAAKLWNVPVEKEVGDREFILIPPGEFMMGSPPGENGRRDDERLHRVRITRPFYIARDDEPFEDETGWRHSLEKMFKQAPAGFRFRLPTEAEWEYAARAGSPGATYWDNGPKQAEYGESLGPLLWNFSSMIYDIQPQRDRAKNASQLYYDFFASCVTPSRTLGPLTPPKQRRSCTKIAMTVEEVRKNGLDYLFKLDAKKVPQSSRRYAPNAWGLFDALGRVEELVADLYTEYADVPLTEDRRQTKDVLMLYETEDFTPKWKHQGGSGDGLVFRGGHSWDDAEAVRAAARCKAGWWVAKYDFIAPRGVRLLLEKLDGDMKPIERKKSMEDELEEWRRDGFR